METKVTKDSSSTTLLTKEHFQEMINFEEWLYNTKYPFVPGIPRKSKERPSDPDILLAYDEPPEFLTFWDLCQK